MAAHLGVVTEVAMAPAAPAAVAVVVAADTVDLPLAAGVRSSLTMFVSSNDIC